jgi:hypothetical protein
LIGQPVCSKAVAEDRQAAPRQKNRLFLPGGRAPPEGELFGPEGAGRTVPHLGSRLSKGDPPNAYFPQERKILSRVSTA